MFTFDETVEMFISAYRTCDMRKATGILDHPSGHIMEGNSGTIAASGQEWAFIMCKVCGEEMHWIS